MSYRTAIPLYVKPYTEAQTIYPLTKYKIQQIQNIIEQSPQKIIPPDWHPPGYVPQEDYDKLSQTLKPYFFTFSYDDFYAYHSVNFFDGPTLYNWVNSQLGRQFLQLPELPDNYFYHVYCQSVFYVGDSSLGMEPLFTWALKYFCSEDNYTIFIRPHLNTTILNKASSKCFPVKVDKMVYSQYDVTTGNGTAHYSNLIGHLLPPLTVESWTLVDFGPNDESDPNGRSLLLSIDGDEYTTFENSIDNLYFRCIAIPELKVDE